ncbi:MAG TPA: hypothetical protein VIG52_04930 [Methyloceanibacter sp.]|jgi:hypothetical protein
MVYRLFSSLFGLGGALVTLLAVSIGASQASAASTKATGNPFDQLKGHWRGGGTMTPINGKPEKVSCRVIYNVADSAVTQTMNCAGTDYKVNTTSKFNYSGGKISGSWNESTHSATGGVSGTARGNTVHARISGDKFSGRMSINVSGKGHTINIVQFDQNSGAYRPVANVSLRR